MHAAPPVRPLSDILLDLGPRPEKKARQIAQQQAAQQWQMDRGPLYKSTPVLNNDPNKVVQEVIFEGFFTPRSASTQLAIFSDDGCEVSVDGQMILTNYGKGQHLPDLNQSFHVLTKFKPVVGKTYTIRVRYSNTIFLGPQDIDGATLFAYQGGGATPVAHIIADVNHDGVIDGKDANVDLREKQGTVVIRDEDKVYEDAKEPARRREVRVGITEGKGKKVTVVRGSTTKGLETNLKLFDAEKKGKELAFNKDNELEVDPMAGDNGQGNVTVWLQGGPQPSSKLADCFLQVKVKGQAVNETLAATVLWVELTGTNTGTVPGKVSPDDIKKGVVDPLYDGYATVTRFLGHENLGVQRAGADADQRQTDDNWNGNVIFPGQVLPGDDRLDSRVKTPFFGTKISTGFFNKFSKVAGAAAPASEGFVQFGFIFRRIRDRKIYTDGSSNDRKLWMKG
jgi:hypothetical protein